MKTFLLIFAFIFLVLVFIVSFVALCIKIYTYCKKHFLEFFDKAQSEIKKIVNNIKKTKINKIFFSIKNFKVTVFNNIKYLLHIVCGSLFIIVFLMSESSLFEGTAVKKFASIIVALLFLFFVVYFMLKIRKDSSVLSKFLASLISIYLAVTFYAVLIMIASKGEAYPRVFIVSFGIFFVCVCCFFLLSSYHVVLSIFSSVLSYFVLLFGGAMAFGLFYLDKYQSSYQEYISQINPDDSFRVVMVLIKIGISGFFEFPSQHILSKLSFVQFMAGKLMEILFLGKIATDLYKLTYCKKQGK